MREGQLCSASWSMGQIPLSLSALSQDRGSSDSGNQIRDNGPSKLRGALWPAALKTQLGASRNAHPRCTHEDVAILCSERPWDGDVSSGTCIHTHYFFLHLVYRGS